jgi:TRAP-type transport system small permease protein
MVCLGPGVAFKPWRRGRRSSSVWPLGGRDMTDANEVTHVSLWRRLVDAYGRLLDWLLVLSVLILVIPVSLQIFSRFTALIPHYIWTEEMARFLFVWTVMIGAMVGVRDNAHFEVDLLPQLGVRGEAIARLCGRIGILAFAIIFLLAGLEFTRFAWNRTSELAELPLWLIHMAWPVCGFTWLAFIGPHLINDVKIIFGGRA